MLTHNANKIDKPRIHHMWEPIYCKEPKINWQAYREKTKKSK